MYHPAEIQACSIASNHYKSTLPLSPALSLHTLTSAAHLNHSGFPVEARFLCFVKNCWHKLISINIMENLVMYPFCCWRATVLIIEQMLWGSGFHLSGLSCGVQTLKKKRFSIGKHCSKLMMIQQGHMQIIIVDLGDTLIHILIMAIPKMTSWSLKFLYFIMVNLLYSLGANSVLTNIFSRETGSSLLRTIAG